MYFRQRGNIATVCTSHPRLEICEAVQTARNAGFRRGAKVVETPDCGSACCISSCLFHSQGIAATQQSTHHPTADFAFFEPSAAGTLHLGARKDRDHCGLVAGRLECIRRSDEMFAMIISGYFSALPLFQAAVFATAWLLPDHAQPGPASLHRQSVQRSVPRLATHLLTAPGEGKRKDGPSR